MKIGSSADPSIINANGKFLNPIIFKKGESVIKYEGPNQDTLRDQIQLHVGINFGLGEIWRIKKGKNKKKS